MSEHNRLRRRLSEPQTRGSLLCTKQLAEALQVHPNTILRWVRQGMPHYRRPGVRTQLRFDLAAVERWLKRER
ncbi:MAG: helix-turn-helix domain-containing protein [Fimbriimonadales bacterium]|nr:helix-turn-helix domain-containing protein [Fimbriimonadales bacterium]